MGRRKPVVRHFSAYEGVYAKEKWYFRHTINSKYKDEKA